MNFNLSELEKLHQGVGESGEKKRRVLPSILAKAVRVSFITGRLYMYIMNIVLCVETKGGCRQGCCEWLVTWGGACC